MLTGHFWAISRVSSIRFGKREISERFQFRLANLTETDDSEELSGSQHIYHQTIPVSGIKEKDFKLLLIPGEGANHCKRRRAEGSSLGQPFEVLVSRSKS